MAGVGTDTRPLAGVRVLPLRGSVGRVGVLALVPGPDARLDDRQLLDPFAWVLGAALERTQRAADAHRTAARSEAG